MEGKPSDLVLRITRENSGSLFSSKCKVRHNLTYNWTAKGKKHELHSYVEHKEVLEKEFTSRVQARMLYEALSIVLEQSRKLKSKGIDLRLEPKDMGLPYFGHGQYISSEELDVLSLPMLLMDLKRRYRLK